ncbi:MBL fold metallo-hydrolase [Thermopirellula anaerolimosa]
MKLIVLGSGGYHPQNERHTLCLVLPEAGLILDAGTAFFRLADYLDHRRWDIFLTHAHLDHIIGLTYYWSLERQTTLGEIVVHGLNEKLEAVRSHLFAEPLFPKMPPYRFTPLDSPRPLLLERPDWPPVEIRHFPLDHPGGSIGYRFDWADRSLAYVTDTTVRAAESYLPHIRGVDLLLHECYFPTGYEDLAAKTGHVSRVQAERVASAAGAKRLVLLHHNPAGDLRELENSASADATVPVTTAYDGLALEF